MNNFIIKGARVVDPAFGLDHTGDVIVRDGVIEPEGSSGSGLRVLDGRGVVVAPGLLDVHVHFREPGGSLAETRRSGAEAAAAGGFTRVVTMPNTSPAGDSVKWLRDQIEDDLPVRILPSACVTRGRQGRELVDMELLAANGASSFTDDGSMVESSELMREAMVRAQRLGLPVLDHAVVMAIAGNGIIRECEVARRFGLPIFRSEAEVEAVRRDIALCRETGCKLDIQHISSGDAVEEIRRARVEGLPVFTEASPHHLALAAEDIPGDDGNYRMNPPLGNRRDVRAIRDGVLDGTITVFATDHAPHAVETKNKGFLKASFGVIGVETAVGVTWQVMVEQEGMAVADWVARWTTGPAQLLGLAAPSLATGQVADLVVIDTSRGWRVEPESFRSLSRNTPFAGWELKARAVLTVCNGKVSYSEDEWVRQAGG